MIVLDKDGVELHEGDSIFAVYLDECHRLFISDILTFYSEDSADNSRFRFTNPLGSHCYPSVEVVASCEICTVILTGEINGESARVPCFKDPINYFKYKGLEGDYKEFNKVYSKLNRI
jgi:hypothetical protein